MVTGLSNISADIDGVVFLGSGNLFGSHFIPGYGHVSGGAVASFSGMNMNFTLVDTDYPVTPSFTNFLEGLTIPGLNSVQARNTPQKQLYVENFNPRMWSLTTVSAVPEPETYDLLG